MKPLSDKKRRFGELYDGDGIGTAKRAGYRGTDNALRVIASRNLRDARVRAIIGARGGTLPPIVGDQPPANAPADPSPPKTARELYERIVADPTARLNHRIGAAKELERLDRDEAERHSAESKDRMPRLMARVHELLSERNKRQRATARAKRLRVVRPPPEAPKDDEPAAAGGRDRT